MGQRAACAAAERLPAGSTSRRHRPPPASATPEGAPAGAINDVTVTAVKYSFTAPESVPAGWTRFTLENQGELKHDFQLYKIEEGKTLDDIMAALESEGPPEWAEAYGSATAAAGASSWFAANLTPGNYVYVSIGSTEGGPPDAAQGMLGGLAVTGAAGPIAEEAPIDMVDHQFVIDGQLAAGEQVLRISNTGSELHEVIFFKLHEGKTVADFMALMDDEMRGEPVPESEIPGEYVGGTFVSPGRVAHTARQFEPGGYVLICFIPSPQHNMQPHAMLGMIQQVTIP